MKSRAFLISHLLVSLVTTNQVVNANIFMPWTSSDATSDAVNPYIPKSRENNRIIGGDRVSSFVCTCLSCMLCTYANLCTFYI